MQGFSERAAGGLNGSVAGNHATSDVRLVLAQVFDWVEFLPRHVSCAMYCIVGLSALLEC